MQLRIQPDESLRSYVERNLFLHLKTPTLNVFRVPELRYCFWKSRQVKTIANIFGWHGSYGFNKLVHLHTDFPIRGVLKSNKRLSYSESEFLLESYTFDDLTRNRSYCPLCVQEDIHALGYSYWRRAHSIVTVCAVHNVKLISHCQFCAKPFSLNGHAVNVMWSGCAGRCLGDAEPTMNTDPVELRLAQFFKKLCTLQYHISAETALRVIEEILKEGIDGKDFEWDFRGVFPKINLSVEKFYEHRAFKFLVKPNHLDLLFELLAVVYEKFEIFLGDYLRHESDPEPIDSYWSSYRISPYGSEQYIEENYCLGVGVWTCRDPDDYRSAWRDPHPITYPCCNLAYPQRKGHQLSPERVGDALPKIPRLGSTGWAPLIMRRSQLSDEK